MLEIRHKRSGKLLYRSDDWRVDARGRELIGAHLSGWSLREARLRGVDLRGSSLDGADLSGADLRGARFRGASFRDAVAIPAGALAALLLAFAGTTPSIWRNWWLNPSLYFGVMVAGALVVSLRSDRALFEDATLDGAQLDGAHYDRETTWPRGFDPQAHGAVRVQPAAAASRGPFSILKRIDLSLVVAALLACSAVGFIVVGFEDGNWLRLSAGISNTFMAGWLLWSRRRVAGEAE
ncbi:MAG: pentapeptide repeat-containing protein [Armatimonadota bacterium]